MIKLVLLIFILMLSLPTRELFALENLVKNPGFDEGMIHWQVKIRGDWANKASQSQIVSISMDADSGKQALLIDTTVINESGEITDELRTTDIKYEIYVTQRVEGAKPEDWYLAKFQARALEVGVDVGSEFLADLKPWTIRERKGSPYWADVPYWKKRVFVPACPMVSEDYREHILLKQTYKDSNAVEVGIRIRSPWTGKVLISEVELLHVDPDSDLTTMEKYLGIRGAKPFTEVRKLNRQTVLVDGGKPTSAILVPDEPLYMAHGEKTQAKIKELTGAELPVVTELADVPQNAQIVALGSMLKNDLVARLHFNRYVKINAVNPGPGGYVIWTVAEPYGLAKKQNVVVVAGSDEPGQSAAVDSFCSLLKPDGNTLELPFLHYVNPQKVIPPEGRDVPANSSGKRRYGYHTKYGGFSKWFLNKWLETGDLEIARMAREEILSIVDDYLQSPYMISEWDTYDVGYSWDVFEEIPVFSDEDRLIITNLLLGYLHVRPRTASDWLVSHFMKDAPLWNHQTKGLAAIYTMGRYFERYYSDQDARYRYYLAAPHNAFTQAVSYSKPQENSGNYWPITIDFAIAYYLGEWDMRFFENEAMRRYAEYHVTVSNSQGWLSGFGDTYYGYHGWTPGHKAYDEFAVPLAFWYYKDPRMLWWLEHCKPDYINPYHQDINPVEWKEMLGVLKTPLEERLYDPSSNRIPFWGAGGESSDSFVGDVRYEETFDKIAFRESWEPDSQYLLLEGHGRGIHSNEGVNQICKLTMLGEDLLIGSTYQKNNPRTNCSVVVVRDASIDDPSVKGNGRFEFQWWHGMKKRTPAYAALETMADLPNTGFTRTSMRDHLGDTDWHRNIFWLKGDYFVLIDEVIPKHDGTYHVEANFSTCPRPKSGNYPRLTKRSWQLVDDKPIFEVTYQRPDGLKHYIVGDGSAKLIIDPFEYRPQYLIKTIVRQMHVGKNLAADETLGLFTLMYGDQEGDRRNYQLERISPTEGIMIANNQAFAYFGCQQSDESRAVFPVNARMFFLTADTLAVVDATAAGDYFASEEPVSREVKIPEGEAVTILNALHNLVDKEQP